MQREVPLFHRIRKSKWLAPVAVFAASFLPDLVVAMGNVVSLAQDGYLLEDAFYYFTIARNFLAGKGFTLDGFTLTNGFHPLYLVTLLPGVALLDSWGVIRYAIILCALFRALTAVGVYAIVRRASDDIVEALFVSLMWCLAAATRQLLLNGMETALFLMFFVWTSAFYMAVRDKFVERPHAWSELAVLIGLGYLARTDMAFLAVAIGLDLLVKYRRKALKPLLHVAVFGMTTVLPWLFVSIINTGGIFPDSGPASSFLGRTIGVSFLDQRIGPGLTMPDLQHTLPHVAMSVKTLLVTGMASWSWSALFSTQLGLTHREFFSAFEDYPLFVFFGGHAWTATAFIVIATTILIHLGRRFRLTFLVLAVLAMWITYGLLTVAPWFAIRYMAPLTLVISVLTGMMVRRFFSHLRLGRAELALFSAVAVAVYGIQYRTLFPRESAPRAYIREAFWVRDNLPKDTVIGSFQAGVMSFLSEHVVVNLDGVMNRYAHKALKERRMGHYVYETGIDYIVDGTGMIDVFLRSENPGAFARCFKPVRKDFFSVYRVHHITRQRRK